jgi:hypothetical protein
MTQPVAWISPGTPIYRVSYTTASGLRAAKFTPATSEEEAIANVRRDISHHSTFEATKTGCVTK